MLYQHREDGPDRIIVCDSKALHILDANTGRTLFPARPLQSHIFDLCFHSSGKRAISCSKTGKLTLWRTEDWQPLMSWSIATSEIYDVEFHGDRLYAATRDIGILVLDGTMPD